MFHSIYGLRLLISFASALNARHASPHWPCWSFKSNEILSMSTESRCLDCFMWSMSLATCRSKTDSSYWSESFKRQSKRCIHLRRYESCAPIVVKDFVLIIIKHCPHKKNGRTGDVRNDTSSSRACQVTLSHVG